jgi:PAS domain S-box-containing protein
MATIDTGIVSENGSVEAETFARKVLNASLNGIYIYDVQIGRHIFVNKQCTSLTGYTLEHLRAMSETEFYGLIHPDDRQRMAAHMESLLHGNDTELEIEYRFKTKDDRWIWCLSRDSVFNRSPSGAVAQIIGTFLDITARRQAEQALRDSETKMRSIFRAAPIGIGVVSNRIFREVNERLCRITGYTKDELIGKNARILYPTDDDYAFVGREKYRQIKISGTGTVETRFRRKDGTVIDVLMSSTPLDPNDLSTGVTFTALDITKRKRAENALKNSEEKLREAQRIAKVGSWWWDVREGTAEWSDQVYEIFKTTRKTPSYNVAKSFVHPDDLNVWQDVVQLAIEQKKSFSLDYRAIRSDGETIWVHNEAEPFFNGQGELTHFKGTVQDITERKLSAEALKESEEHLRLSLEGSGVSFWEWFPQSGRVCFDDRGAEMMGYRPKERDFDFKWWSDGLHPDSRSIFEKALNDYLEGRRSRHELEYKFRTKTGAWKWIWAAGKCVEWDNDKRPVRFLGTHRDITERKREEKILRRYSQQLELEVGKRTVKIEKQYQQLTRMNLLIKKMARQTIKAMENERKALSKEIHDSIGGSLAAIKMLLESRLKNSTSSQPSMSVSLEKIIDHLSEVIEESRRIAYQMRPLVLDDYGLTSALSEYFQYFKGIYPRVNIVHRLDISSRSHISDDVKTVIYRVVQEALNNIGKHSGADTVRVEMLEHRNKLLLKIEDNGCGFEASKVLDTDQPLMGYGIHSMKERIEICNGTFQLESAPGKGTLISASIPKKRKLH